jgi:hypothetical protein
MDNPAPPEPEEWELVPMEQEQPSERKEHRKDANEFL